ncbi:PAS domain-containing protein [Rhodovastum atsumiense]|uniref:histidine kinase n=1 Tax=Rhodovastum atsumiense TaxID=504468 RepID=A0A5M6J2D9_9PROT|nr:PAS domain-containing protein [Rhodovastum atsumiense]KAA5614691.1 PAS domain-containing protein [Rhodovastum atsumiense]
MSLRSCLLGLALAILLPAALISFVDLADDVAMQRAEQERGLEAAARGVALTIDRDIAGLALALAALGPGPDLEGPDRQAAYRARAADLARSIDARLVLRGPNGTARVQARPASAPAEAPLCTAADAAPGGTGGTGDMPASLRAGLVNVTARNAVQSAAALAVPVLRDGSIVGVIDTLLTEPRLLQMIERQGLAADVAVDVLDAAGTVAARRPVADGPDLGHPLGLLAAANGRVTGHAEGAAADGTPMVHAFARIAVAPDWLVVVSQKLPDTRVIWSQPLLHHAGAFALVAAFAVCLALWLAARLVQPITLLGTRAQAITAGIDPPAATRPFLVAELEALRAAQLRAESMLRRRQETERIALREARTGAELLASVVNGTADIIHVTDRTGRYVLVNRAGLAAHGMGEDEWRVLGRHPAELFPAELAAQMEQADREVLATATPVTIEAPWTPADGGQRSFSITKSPWRGPRGEVSGVVSVMRDVADQRAAEARLRAAQAELLRVTRLSAMGAMASGLAHELNQPLAAASNFMAAIRRMLAHGTPSAELQETVPAALGEAGTQVQRAGEIVRRLREFVSRGEAELRLVELGELLGEAEDLVHASAILGPIRLVVHRPDGPLWAMADRTQIQQVLLNLVRNAAEAIRGQPEAGGGDKAGGSIVLSAATAAQGEVEIAVVDNGPGLPVEVRARLFEPFVSTKPDGMGIGLAICSTIIEGHGGRLCAETGPDGTVFRIVLPPARQPGAIG